MTERKHSLQDLIRARQQSGFVGRQGQIFQYRENISIPVDDTRRRFLFNIHGDAGVGKTYLTKQLQRIAIDSGALTAYTDETIDDVTLIMSTISEQFARNGVYLKEFSKQSTAYQRRRHELESDPQAPDGIAAFVTKATVKIGLQAASDVPIAGSLIAPVDPDAAADQINRARIYIARKFKDHAADVRLLLSPTEELTQIFVASLNSEVGDRPIAVFFDTYERTAPILDGWLQDLYRGRYGDLPAGLITTISGQHPLNPNLWSDYLPVIADVPLAPFSEAEARQFLAGKGVANEPTIEVILNLSGRLPMWLATLAEARPDDASHIGDPAGGADERFLKWEGDPDRRHTAIIAALPRTFNRDVLSVLATPEKTQEIFEWLCALPFVTRQEQSWRYHEVVRAAMLRLQRAQSPNQWRINHRALAEAHAHWAAEAANNKDKIWSNPRFMDHIREETYHALCADPSNDLSKALGTAVKAAESSVIRARQWVELLIDAGRDTENSVLAMWGQRLRDAIHDDDLTEYLTLLINEARLEPSNLILAFEERGICRRDADHVNEAILDFNAAIELDHDRVWSIAGRGEAYRRLGRYDEALTDFNRAIELDPDYAWGIDSRGRTYQAMGRYDEALADFNRAIELDPTAEWAIASRGELHRLVGRYDEALTDLNRATELDPTAAWAIGDRGETYRLTDRNDEALTDFNRAIELEPDYAWAIGSRGQTYHAMDRYDEALTDLNRAIELNPDYAWAIAHRGQTYRLTDRYDEALTDFNRAIELDPDLNVEFDIRSTQPSESDRCQGEEGPDLRSQTSYLSSPCKACR